MGDYQNDQFETYYRELYGTRWDVLRNSLLQERPAFAFAEGLVTPYFMDHASVLAAGALRVTSCPAEEPETVTVLDACAAPGGKSLVIAANLLPGATLLSNELSADRRRRLSDVLDKHLDSEKREQVRVCGFDAAAEGRRKSEHGRYGAILLDAPCSSEAHVLKDSKALAAWTPARPRFLAGRQWALLSSAFLLLAPGGSLVYSTCAITKVENDGVIKRLVKKYGAQLEPDPVDFPEGEKTEFGVIMLPDHCGVGPLYVARFVKRA